MSRSMLRNAIRDKYIHLEIIEGIGLTVSRATLEGLQTILEVLHGDVTAELTGIRKSSGNICYCPVVLLSPSTYRRYPNQRHYKAGTNNARGHIAPHGPANPAQLSPAADFSGAARPGRLTEARLVGKAASEALQGSLHTEVELILGGRWR